MDENEIGFVPLVTSFLIGIITILIIYWYSKWNHDYWKKRGIPYIEPIPFFGSALEILFTPPPIFELKRYLQLGPIYGYFERSRPCLTIGDPKILKDIMVKDFPTFSTRREYTGNSDVIDKMLIAAQGEQWKRLRTIISPTFTSGKLRRMIGIIGDCSKTLTANLKTPAIQGSEIDVKRMFGAYTMDIIASTAFSTKLDSHNDPDNEFVKTAKIVFQKRGGWRFLLHFLYPDLATFFGISIRPDDIFLFKDLTLRIIEERKRTGVSRNDFLQLLLDASKEIEDQESLKNQQGNENEDIPGNGDEKGDEDAYQSPTRGLTLSELVAQCVIFFLAGYETTSSAISNVTYSLATNQHVQEKLRQEVDEVLERNKGELTYESLMGMKYLDNVISETLRLYPPVARIERIADADYESEDLSFKIPKRTLIAIPIYPIHRDPHYFPDPEKFDPDRFTPEERANRDPFTYIPFAIGPRNCVAMRFALLEMKVCLVHVVRNFIIKTCSRTKIPLEYNTGRAQILTKEVILKMELRENTLAN